MEVGDLVSHIKSGKLYKIEYMMEHGRVGIKRCFKDGRPMKSTIIYETGKDSLILEPLPKTTIS